MSMGGFPEEKRNVEQKGTVEKLACQKDQAFPPVCIKNNVT